LPSCSRSGSAPTAEAPGISGGGASILESCSGYEPDLDDGQVLIVLVVAFSVIFVL
jgi:hypothetical protein